MLLETFSATGDNVLIFSANRFNTAENFHIVYKQTHSKKPEPIRLVEVLQYVYMPVTKNLIVYRLLTNIKGFNTHMSRYGIVVKIDYVNELVYLDPVYAIREIEELQEKLDFSSFRFKIQQVGLKAVAGEMPLYSEIYSFDLLAEEARNQNDRVFAEAIYAFEESFILMDEDTTPEAPLKNEIPSSEGQLKSENKPTARFLIVEPEEIEALRSDEDLKHEEETLNENGIPEKTDDRAEVHSAEQFPDYLTYPGGIAQVEEPLSTGFSDEAKLETDINKRVEKVLVRTMDNSLNDFGPGFSFSSLHLNENIFFSDPEEWEDKLSFSSRRLSTISPAEYISGGAVPGTKIPEENLEREKMTEDESSGELSLKDFLSRRRLEGGAGPEGNPVPVNDNILGVFKSASATGSFLESRKKHPVLLRIKEV